MQQAAFSAVRGRHPTDEATGQWGSFNEPAGIPRNYRQICHMVKFKSVWRQQQIYIGWMSFITLTNWLMHVRSSHWTINYFEDETFKLFNLASLGLIAGLIFAYSNSINSLPGSRKLLIYVMSLMSVISVISLRWILQSESQVDLTSYVIFGFWFHRCHRVLYIPWRGYLGISIYAIEIRFPISIIMALIQRDKNDIYPFISSTAGLKDSAKGKTVLVTGGGKGIGRVWYLVHILHSTFSCYFYRFISHFSACRPYLAYDLMNMPST